MMENQIQFFFMKCNAIVYRLAANSFVMGRKIITKNLAPREVQNKEV